MGTDSGFFQFAILELARAFMVGGVALAIFCGAALALRLIKDRRA